MPSEISNLKSQIDRQALRNVFPRFAFHDVPNVLPCNAVPFSNVAKWNALLVKTPDRHNVAFFQPCHPIPLTHGQVKTRVGNNFRKKASNVFPFPASHSFPKRVRPYTHRLSNLRNTFPSQPSFTCINYVSLCQHRLSLSFSSLKASFGHTIRTIIALCSKKQVRWITARRIIAFVQNAHSCWNWPISDYPCCTMSQHCRPVKSYDSVTLCGGTGRIPQPAFIFSPTCYASPKQHIQRQFGSLRIGFSWFFVHAVESEYFHASNQ